MNTTILFFSEFGRVSTVRGSLQAIIEQPVGSDFKSTFDIHLVTAAGNPMTISTGCDFYVFSGFYAAPTQDTWTSFSHLELDELASALPQENRMFSRLSFNITNSFALNSGMVSLLPAPTPVPESKRIIGRLISEKLSQHGAF